MKCTLNLSFTLLFQHQIPIYQSQDLCHDIMAHSSSLGPLPIKRYAFFHCCSIVHIFQVKNLDTYWKSFPFLLPYIKIVHSKLSQTLTINHFDSAKCKTGYRIPVILKSTIQLDHRNIFLPSCEWPLHNKLNNNLIQ